MSTSQVVLNRIAEIKRLHREGWTPLKISRQMFFRGFPMRIETVVRILESEKTTCKTKCSVS